MQSNKNLEVFIMNYFELEKSFSKSTTLYSTSNMLAYYFVQLRT